MFHAYDDRAGTFKEASNDITSTGEKIAEALQMLIYDIEYWMKEKEYTELEIVAQFWARFIHIKPFDRFNELFAMICCDVLIYYEAFSIKMELLISLKV